MTDDDNMVIIDTSGVKYQEQYIDQQEKEYESVLNIVEKNGAPNRSFESVLNSYFPNYINDRFWKFMLSSYLEFDTGGDIRKLSSTDFYDDKNVFVAGTVSILSLRL